MNIQTHDLTVALLKIMLASDLSEREQWETLCAVCWSHLSSIVKCVTG